MTSGYDELRAELVRLEEAESRGDFEVAVELKRRLVESRLLARLERGSEHVAELDLQLFDSLALDLECLGLAEAAVSLLRGAHLWAVRNRDAYGAQHFLFRQTEASTAALRFRDAEATLEEALRPLIDTALGSAQDLVDRIETADFLSVSGASAVELRVEALTALGRFWAANGRLDGAAVALERALRLLDATGTVGTARERLSTRLAEVHLDRGDLEAFDAWAKRSANPAHQPIWHMLAGTAAQMAGHLTAAERHFYRVVRTPLEGWREWELVRQATWCRFHVLTFLNRLQEAEESLESCVEMGGFDVQTTALAQELLAARRYRDGTQLGLPPSPFEISLGHRRALELTGAVNVEADGPVVGRRRERVRDEWAWRANSVLASLSRGELAAAEEEFASLEDWTASLIESDYLTARGDCLGAVVLLALGDSTAAAAFALRARESFSKLGLPLDEWAACQLVEDAAEASGEPALGSSAAGRSMELLRRLESAQDDIDSRLFRLNKPTRLDRKLDSICRRATEAERTSPSVARHLDELLSVRSATSGDRHEGGAARLFLESGMEGSALPASRKAVRDLPPWTPRRRWLPPDLGVLMYVVLPDRVELFVTTREGVFLVPMTAPCSRAELWDLIRRVARLLRNRPWDASMAASERLASVLGLTFLAEHLPPTVRRVAIVPDDMLAHVPFAALPIAGRPLVNRFSPFLTPIRWSVRRDRPPRLRDGLGVAVTQSRYDATQVRLDSAPEILEAMASSADRVELLVDRGATRQTVLEKLREADVAHFACHGEFVPDSPDRSGFLLDDSWLTVRDLFAGHFRRLELVCASACWSANVAVVPGGQPVGVPAAWIAGGARTVVSSLWPVVESRREQTFFRCLYRSVRDYGVAAGLAAAQIEASDAGIEPVHWGGYVLQADGIVPRAAARWWLRLGALLPERRRRTCR